MSGGRGSAGTYLAFAVRSSHCCHPRQYLKKLHTQERAVEEVKLAIKPYYQKKDITKEEYKDILRKAVHKVGPRGGKMRRGGERMRRSDGREQTGIQRWGDRGAVGHSRRREGDRIASSPPGPVLLASEGQVGTLAWILAEGFPSQSPAALSSPGAGDPAGWR